MAGSCGSMFLLLGASGVGKTLLVKRLHKLSSRDGAKDLGEPPATQPTVGTNLTDLSIGKKITIRELGGCMGPIWSSYYNDCRGVLYVIDAAKPTQISSSCVQLLTLLSDEQLISVPVLLIFNKIDLPCYMSLVEMKSLFRIQDIIACAKQTITIVEQIGLLLDTLKENRLKLLNVLDELMLSHETYGPSESYDAGKKTVEGFNR